MSATASNAELIDRVAALESQVAELRERLERAEITSAVARGLDEADRNLGTPARDVVARLRAKHNLPQ